MDVPVEAFEDSNPGNADGCCVELLLRQLLQRLSYANPVQQGRGERVDVRRTSRGNGKT